MVRKTRMQDIMRGKCRMPAFILCKTKVRDVLFRLRLETALSSRI